MALIATFRNRGLSENEAKKKAFEFLRSDVPTTAPRRQIFGLLYAALAMRAQNGQVRAPNQGMATDISVIADLLSYCDAMFVDNAARALVEDIPKPQATLRLQGLLRRCSFRVFGVFGSARSHGVRGAPQQHSASIRVGRCSQCGPEAVRSSRRGDGRESSPNRLHLPCQTLLSLIRWAYGTFAEGRFDEVALPISVSERPSWIRTELFEIDAKAEKPQRWGTLNGPMLRSLLEVRFHLKIRKETQDGPVYAITVARGGPKLQASRGNCITNDPENPALPIEPGKPLPPVCGMARLTSTWEAFGVRMDQFATIISAFADRRVIDRTGLPGSFDVRLDLTAADFGAANRTNDFGPGADTPEPTDTFASIRGAVQKLGLPIESARGPVESFVIDEVPRPSEN